MLQRLFLSELRQEHSTPQPVSSAGLYQWKTNSIKVRTVLRMLTGLPERDVCFSACVQRHVL